MRIGKISKMASQKTLTIEHNYCFDVRYAYDVQYWTNYMSQQIEYYSTPWRQRFEKGIVGAKSSNDNDVEEDVPPHKLLVGQEGCPRGAKSMNRMKEQNAQQMQSKNETHRSLVLQLQRNRLNQEILSKPKLKPTSPKKILKNSKHANPINPQIQFSEIKPCPPKSLNHSSTNTRPSYASVSNLRIGKPSQPTNVMPVRSTANLSNVSVSNMGPGNTNNPNLLPRNLQSSNAAKNIDLPNAQLALSGTLPPANDSPTNVSQPFSTIVYLPNTQFVNVSVANLRIGNVDLTRSTIPNSAVSVRLLPTKACQINVSSPQLVSVSSPDSCLAVRQPLHDSMPNPASINVLTGHNVQRSEEIEIYNMNLVVKFK